MKTERPSHGPVSRHDHQFRALPEKVQKAMREQYQTPKENLDMWAARRRRPE